MKKRLFTVFLALLLGIIPAVPIFAAGELSRLIDEADLLSDDEEVDLLNKLDEISERQQVDIVVVTTSSLDGASPMEYADDFFDYNGYGYGEERDGILILISTEERDWYISTSGYGITAVTDAGLEYMSEQFLPYLSDDDYATAFTVFAELCDDYITQARTGEAYDVGNLKKGFFGIFQIPFAFFIAFIISLIETEGMRLKLGSVHSQPAADDYIKRDSIQVTKTNDLFLYRHVDRRKKPKRQSSGRAGGGSTTHRSSSGRRHGGRGGRF